MNKIKIVTDSAATMTENMIQENNIDIVCLKVIWEEENINGSVKSNDLFKKMRNTLSENPPRTSQPSSGDFKKAFEKSFETCDEIICVTISTGISGTYNSAMQAIKFLPKEKQDKVTVIDSVNVDGGEGLIALKAIELVQKGFESKEIVSKIQKFKKNVEIVGFPGDPKWLEKNGRLSKAGANILRKMEKIGIRPLLTLKKGKVAATSIKFKAKNKIESLLRVLKEKIKDKEAVLVITHSDMLESAKELKEKLIKECPDIKVLFLGEINPVIGSHLGPDSIICCYYLKENDVL